MVSRVPAIQDNIGICITYGDLYLDLEAVTDGWFHRSTAVSAPAVTYLTKRSFVTSKTRSKPSMEFCRRWANQTSISLGWRILCFDVATHASSSRQRLINVSRGTGESVTVL